MLKVKRAGEVNFGLRLEVNKLEKKTLFLGLDIGQTLKDEIEEYAEKVKSLSKKGKWKDADNYHITIKYIGETEQDRIEQIDLALEQIEVESFSLGVEDLRCFKKGEKLKVLYMAIGGELEKLNAVYREVEEFLVAAGFKAERRNYTPHITLGNDTVFDMELEALKKELDESVFSEIKVDRITLFESKRENERRVYRPLKDYLLEKREEEKI